MNGLSLWFAFTAIGIIYGVLDYSMYGNIAVFSTSFGLSVLGAIIGGAFYGIVPKQKKKSKH